MKEKIIDNDSKLIIFGTGNYGAMALQSLEDKKRKVDYFCDNNKNNWGMIWKGYKIISLDELKEYPDSTVVIASLHFEYMKKQLDNIGISRIHDCSSLFDELDLTKVKAFAHPDELKNMRDLYMFAIHKKKNSLRIKTLDVVVTEKCSLNCLNCANLMQYYKKPKDCSTELLLNSLDRFMINIDELYEARVLGGEPFLYRNLPLVVKALSSYDNCFKIIIYTNGTIIPRDMEYLKEKKVSVKISDYGNLSRNKKNLEDLLKKNQIPFISEKMDSWQDCGEIKYRKRSESQLKNTFGNCCVNDTLTLLHGKLYRCPFVAHAENLKAIPIRENIDIKAENLRSKINKLYSYKDFTQACNYCNGRDFDVGKVKVAQQIPRGGLC